jgi:hypothetical protein
MCKWGWVMRAAADRPKPVQGDLTNLPAVLGPLVADPRWVLWQYEFVKGKWTKVPYRPTGQNAKSNDPTTWSSYSDVISAWQANRNRYAGIGFCLRGSNIAAFDVDDCRNPENGLLHPFAEQLVTRAGTYVEITPSDKGLRIIGTTTATTKLDRQQRVDDTVFCETYRRPDGRYITITGNPLPGSLQQLSNLDALVEQVVAELAAQNRPHDAGGDDPYNEDEEDAAGGGATELPQNLVDLLHTPNSRAGEPHAGFATRSELAFAFIIGALRAGIGAKRIAKECIDATYRGCAIYEHCLQNRGRPYVLEQIKHAKIKLQESLDAEIAGLNKNHALVLAGNKASIMKFEIVDGRDQFRLVQVGAFKTWFANKQVTIGRRVASVADFWINHRQRRQYEGIEFAPNGGRDGYYNLWRGFTVEPRKVDQFMEHSKFVDHLKKNVAQDNVDDFNWIFGWFAQIFQQLHVKTGTALCLRGKQGVGKTKVGQVFGALLGEHYELVSDPRYITGQFNSHMAALLILHADEAFWAGDKRSEGKLKDLVTGLKHRLEFKGVDPILVDNHIRLFVTGNQDWLIPAGFGERRFAILDVGEGNMKDRAYFKAIDDEMNNGGREALLHELLTFDLSQINLGEIPQTGALLEQIIESATPEQAWWLDTLKRGQLPRGTDVANTTPKRTLFRRYIRHANLQGVRRRAIEVKIGIFLRKYVGPGLKSDKRQTYTIYHRDRQYEEYGWIYEFPSLAKCRETFAKEMQQTIDWGPSVMAPTTSINWGWEEITPAESTTTGTTIDWGWEPREMNNDEMEF